MLYGVLKIVLLICIFLTKIKGKRHYLHYISMFVRLCVCVCVCVCKLCYVYTTMQQFQVTSREYVTTVVGL